MKLIADLNYCYSIFGIQFAMGPYLLSFIWSFLSCIFGICFSSLDRFGRWYEIIYKWKRMHNHLYWNYIVWDIPFRTNFWQGFCLIVRTFFQRTDSTTTFRWKLKTHRFTSHILFSVPKFEMPLVQQHTTEQRCNLHLKFRDILKMVSIFRFLLHANRFYWFFRPFSFKWAFRFRSGYSPGSKKLVLHYNIWLQKRRCKDSLEFRIKIYIHKKIKIILLSLAIPLSLPFWLVTYKTEIYTLKYTLSSLTINTLCSLFVRVCVSVFSEEISFSRHQFSFF